MSKQQVQKQQSLQVTNSYSGPVPPPAVMEGFEKILPGSAERIFSMAEKEQQAKINHLEESDRQIGIAIEKAHKEKILSYWMAFFLAIFFTVLGTGLVYCGHEYIGSGLLTTTMCTVICSFLSKKKK